MENGLFYERKKETLITEYYLKKKDISKKINDNESLSIMKIKVFNDWEKRTSSTHKNSADSLKSLYQKGEKLIESGMGGDATGIKKNLNKIYFEEVKQRKDNFGREIKKGGKHKIAFADDLDIIKSLMPENNVNGKLTSRQSMKIRNNTPLKNLENNFIIDKPIRRTNSLNNNITSMMKNIYNMSKIKTKKFKKSIIQIINVENLKQETKLNTFFFKRNPNAEEENVACSCYCSIW